MWLRKLILVEDLQSCASFVWAILRAAASRCQEHGALSPEALTSESDACMCRLPSTTSRMRLGRSMGHRAPRAASSGRAQPGVDSRRPRPTSRAHPHMGPGRLPARASQHGGAERRRSQVIRPDISRVHGRHPCSAPMEGTVPAWLH